MIAQVFKREHVEYVARVELHISQMLWLCWAEIWCYLYVWSENEWGENDKESERAQRKGDRPCVHCTYVIVCVFGVAQKRKDTRRFRQFNKQFCLICYCVYVCASSSSRSSSSNANKCFGTPVRNYMWNDTQPSDTCNTERERIDTKRKMKIRQHKKGMECKQTFLYITLICTRKCMWEIFYIAAVSFHRSTSSRVCVRVKCFELLAIQTSNKKAVSWNTSKL